MTTITPLNDTTTKYRPNDEPHKGYTMTYSQERGCDTWTYRPTDDNPAIAQGKKDIKVIETICSKLPKRLLWYVGPEYDYPQVANTALAANGYDRGPRTNRPVWVFDGQIYFRRYNDDWNATVMKGTAGASGYVSWTYPATREELQEMLVKLG